MRGTESFRNLLLIALGLLLLPLGSMAMTAGNLAGKRVAVAAFALDKEAGPFVRMAQSRLELILADNGVQVLDQKKLDELKDVWKRLEDPGYFITAEEFVENADKYKLDGLVRLYLTADAVKGLADYYTATAEANVRFVGNEQADVDVGTTKPMGARGNPPSDGLTRDSALINALQRAIDEGAEKMDLRVIDPATPRSIPLRLEGPVKVAQGHLERGSSGSGRQLASAAELENRRWRKEEVTCTALSPGGSLGAVAGYVVDTDFHRRPPRIYGSRVHLVDAKTRREITVFETSPVEKKSKREHGTKKVIDCLFIGSWRYLSAATGSRLFLWDTERGRELSSVKLTSGLERGRLGMATSAGEHYIAVDSGGSGRTYYRISVGR